MAPSPPTRPPAVVEVLVSSPGFSDAEHVEFTDDRTARAFARDVMQFALTGGRSRRRQPAVPAADSQGKE